MNSPQLSPWAFRAVLLALLLGLPSCQRQTGTEILWDTYGVPHIFSSDAEVMFAAQGWAQMKAHGDLILQLYGRARGKAAEYWGEDYLMSDVRTRSVSLPDRAAAWTQAQDPELARYLASFVQGMNDYAQEHLDVIADEMEVVLPVMEEDVMAHLLQAILKEAFAPTT